MINGCDHFNFLGMLLYQNAQALVFQEGLYFQRGDLLQATPADSDDSDAAHSDSDDMDMRPARLLTTMPIADGSLGWHPFDELLFAGNVSEPGLMDALMRCHTWADKQSVVQRLRQGAFNPAPNQRPSFWMAFRQFNLIRFMGGPCAPDLPSPNNAQAPADQPAPLRSHEPTLFFPFDHPAMRAAKLNGDRARRQLQSPSASLAKRLRWQPLRDHMDAQCLGVVPHAPLPALVFDQGIYIQQHEDDAMVGWHPWVAPHCAGHLLPDRIPAIKHLLLQADTVGALSQLPPIPWQPPGDPASRFVFVGRELLAYVARPCLHVLPSTMLPVDGPAGAAQAQAVLRQGRYAPCADPLTVRFRFETVPHDWGVDAFEWTQRLIAIKVWQRNFVPYNLHTAVLTLVREFFKVEQTREAEWLQNGTVPMPIAALLDLMTQDMGMRCADCVVQLPVNLYPAVLQLGGLSVKSVLTPNSGEALKQLIPQMRDVLVLLGTERRPMPSCYVTKGGMVLGPEGPLSFDEFTQQLGLEGSQKPLVVRGLVFLA